MEGLDVQAPGTFGKIINNILRDTRKIPVPKSV